MTVLHCNCLPSVGVPSDPAMSAGRDNSGTSNIELDVSAPFTSKVLFTMKWTVSLAFEVACAQELTFSQFGVATCYVYT